MTKSELQRFNELDYKQGMGELTAVEHVEFDKLTRMRYNICCDDYPLCKLTCKRRINEKNTI